MKNQINNELKASAPITTDANTKQFENDISQAQSRPGGQQEDKAFETTACGLRVTDDEEGEEREF